MGDQQNANPILPAPRVSRNPSTFTAASRTTTGRQYDDGSVNRDNRSRGEMSDKGRSAVALLRCKSLLQIGTHNVNTLREENKAAELEQRNHLAGIEIFNMLSFERLVTATISHPQVGGMMHKPPKVWMLAFS